MLPVHLAVAWVCHRPGATGGTLGVAMEQVGAARAPVSPLAGVWWGCGGRTVPTH